MRRWKILRSLNFVLNTLPFHSFSYARSISILTTLLLRSDPLPLSFCSCHVLRRCVITTYYTNRTSGSSWGTQSVRLSKRPILFVFVGGLYGAGALCGPMFGGLFSQLASWGWCFYVNLPVGGIVFLSVLLFFEPYSQSQVDTNVRQKSNIPVFRNTFSRRMKALE